MPVTVDGLPPVFLACAASALSRSRQQQQHDRGSDGLGHDDPPKAADLVIQHDGDANGERGILTSMSDETIPDHPVMIVSLSRVVGLLDETR